MMLHQQSDHRHIGMDHIRVNSTCEIYKIRIFDFKPKFDSALHGTCFGIYQNSWMVIKMLIVLVQARKMGFNIGVFVYHEHCISMDCAALFLA
mmetsp:Transcript_2955/g.3471  ORF Transcript_2955/g.3471 Transcript_2955/m.3471 type:complete len:93 (-) Transcript_2955:28-306(-)